MKKLVLTIFSAAIIAILHSLNKNVISYSTGAPTGSTNAPGETTCSTNMFCHNGTPNTGNGGTMLITMEDISNGYVGGATYIVMPYVNQSGFTKIGFQTVALLTNGNSAGTVAIMNSKTQMNTANGNEYVTHTASGNNNVALHDWMYEWTAPPQGSGTVIIYGAFIASNNDMTTKGDSIYTDSLVLFENTTGLINTERKDGITIFPNPNDGKFALKITGIEPGMRMAEIYNAEGKKIHTSEILKEVSEIDISTLPEGVYFIFPGEKNRITKILKL